MTNDSSRASHKTDRSRGQDKIQKCDKTLVNKGRFEFITPPHVGKGVGIPNLDWIFIKMVEPERLELSTPTMPLWCSTN